MYPQTKNKKSSRTDENLKVVMIPHNHEYVKCLKRSLEKKNVEVTLLPPFHWSTLSNFTKLLLLKFKGYEIIHVHWLYVFPFTILMKVFVKFARGLGYKIVWTIHEIVEYGGKSEKLIKKSRWFYFHTDYRYIHYKSNLEKLHNILHVSPEKNIGIIFHPNFIDSYSNKINKEKAREKLAIPMDRKVLLTFGLIKRYKGVDIFVRILEALGDEYIGIIAGKGYETDIVEFLEKREREMPNLIFVNKFIPDEEVQIYFNAADVVVLPYKKEEKLGMTVSGIIPLAFSFSKPVVATGLDEMTELVSWDRGRIIKDPENVSEFVTEIKKLFKRDYEKLGKNGYEFIKRESWEKLAKVTIIGYKKSTSAYANK